MKISGKQVAAARELLGFSQTELSIAAGVGRQTVTRFEAGQADPQRSSREKILTELERRGIEFINGVGPGVRLNLEKAAAFVRATAQRPNKTDR